MAEVSPDDEYGYRAVFRRCGLEELIERFNREVGNPGWVRARSFYLAALRERLGATSLDCSEFIDDETMSLRYRVRLIGRKLVQIRE